jgi:hypothetical protein
MATKKSALSNGSARHAKAAANGRWLARLGMYHRKRALTFENEQELKKAINALCDPGDELFRMPRAPAGVLTMIVPEESVPLFRARRFNFVEYPVVSATRGTGRPSDSNVA